MELIRRLIKNGVKNVAVTIGFWIAPGHFSEVGIRSEIREMNTSSSY
jgi:hypothetical protein